MAELMYVLTRELAALRLIADGKTNKEIANALGIASARSSPRTSF